MRLMIAISQLSTTPVPHKGTLDDPWINEWHLIYMHWVKYPENREIRECERGSDCTRDG